MSAPGSEWTVQHQRGEAGAFHALEPTGDARVAWWLDVDRPAVVLGSTQADDVVDHEACRSAGIEVVRRRSGGGVVLLMPGECAWLDVVVPRVDPLWDDDIGRSMWWFGDVWAEALVALGVDGVAVHRGPVQHTTWSRLVCFDGLGAGEVTVAGRKVVGISQRRTRAWARLQSTIHLAEPRQEQLATLLSPPRPTADELKPPAAVDVALDAVQRAVTTALSTR